MTLGIISSLNRTALHGNRTVKSMQVDAALNRGNSGGGFAAGRSRPLDQLNTAIASSTGENTGVGSPSPHQHRGGSCH